MSVIIDGVDLANLGVKATVVQRPMLSGTRDRTIVIPGRHGAYDFGADIELLPFELTCVIPKQPSAADLQRKAREVARLLTDQSGRPKTVELRTSDESDKFYRVRYSGSVPFERLARVGRFTAQLIAYDPFAYSKVTNDEITWGSEEVVFTDDYLLGHEGGEVRTITNAQSFNVVVNGDAIRPIFYINGSGTNVTISANGKLFSLGTFSSVNWTVDGDKYTVLKDGANGLSEFTGEWLELFNGDNTVSISGSSLNFTFQVKFRDKYVI